MGGAGQEAKENSHRSGDEESLDHEPSPLSAQWVRSSERTAADADFVSNASDPARRRTCQQISSRRGSMAWTTMGTRTEAWPFGSRSNCDQHDNRTYSEDVWNGATGGARAITSENVGFWSRPGMSEDPQLPRGLGLGTVMCPSALSISAALSGVMLSSVSGSSQDGMTAYKTAAVCWTEGAGKRRRASMMRGRSRNRLLAVWVGSWEDDPNTRPKGFNASPESRAVVLGRKTTELSVTDRAAVKRS